MTNIESAVARHYGSAGLLDRILAGLEASGVDPGRARPEDLAPVDEFHIGGREATVHAVAKMSPRPGQRVLDVGCGIGGAARYLAAEIGCRVSGIDLTPEYIAAARALTDLTGLGDKVDYEVAGALAMPFKDATFDAAITIHVAMNIADRAGLYREISRVTKPGAAFCVYDVMRKNDAPLVFPVPWAASPETSHLTTPEEMRTHLDAAGFAVEEVEDRSEVARDFFHRRLAAAKDGPPPLGPHLVMGESAGEKLRNVLVNIEAGRIAPVLMLARRKAG